MKYIWPPLMKAIHNRQKMVADGLAAADRSQRDLEAAQLKVREMIDEAKQQANLILENTHKRANGMIQEARDNARIEAERVLNNAQVEIEQSIQAAKEKLTREVTSLAVMGAEKIIMRNMNSQDNHVMLEQLIAEVK
jgi:F-type H+-transporting ATPase subunit b